jgi:uncharacterized membrane protein
LTATASTTAVAVGGDAVHTVPRQRARWRRVSPHVLGVGLITAAFATLYSTYLLMVHTTMRDGLADVGEYDQAISGYAHFMGPHSPFIGMRGYGSAGTLQLADHFTPLLALLAPFYWIHDGPETLLIETGVLAALPIIPLWLFVRRAVGEFRRLGPAAAYLVVLGYAASWPLQMALWFEFHEVFLAVPVLMWMFERAQAERLRQAALISLLLLGVKDDMGFVVAVFGLYLASHGATLRSWGGLARRAVRAPKEFLWTLVRGDRRWFLALAVIGLGMVWLVNRELLPYFGGSPNRNFTYTEFGRTQNAAVEQMLRYPGTTLGTLVNSPFKTQTLTMLLWPVLGLCLFSPLALMAVPLILERFLSVNQLYWVMPYHYNAFLLAMIFCGGVDGAVRLSRRLSTARPLAARIGPRGPQVRGALLAAFALFVAVHSWATADRYPLHMMNTSSFWHTKTKTIVAGKAAAAHVPSGVLVAAATQLGPQLLSRDKVVMWTFPGDRGYPDAPWVVADTSRKSYPFSSVEAQQADVQWLQTKGYRIVFQQDGWVVLHEAGLPGDQSPVK